MAAPSLNASELRFLRALLRRKVQFMVVGWSAAALQGAPVVTEDVDLWFENLSDPKLSRALEAVGAPRRDATPGLTQRQREVLRLILKGYSNLRISEELRITPNTVKQHAHAIFATLGVSSRAEAVVAAARLGLTLG